MFGRSFVHSFVHSLAQKHLWFVCICARVCTTISSMQTSSAWSSLSFYADYLTLNQIRRRSFNLCALFHGFMNTGQKVIIVSRGISNEKKKNHLQCGEC